MGCGNSSNQVQSAEPDTEAYIIHLINSSNIPTRGVDILEGIQAYCKIKVKTFNGEKKTTTSNRQFTECKTTIRHSSDEPAWNCYRKIVASKNDIIHINLYDEDWFIDDFLGVATLPINDDIKFNEIIELPFIMKTEFTEFEANIRIRLYKESDYSFLQKRIYFLRHGESEFNAALQKTDLVEMFGKTDHPLTEQGIKQCEVFNNAMRNEENKDFNEVDAIWSSPLTRTVQTALISLDKHPILIKNGILLTSNCREFKSIGGRDSTGKGCGADIRERCLTKLKKYREDGFVDRFAYIAWDFNDTCSEWWSGMNDKSEKEVNERFYDFVSFLRYRPERNVIIVTHSVFVRYFFKRYLPKKEDNDMYYDNLFGEEYETNYVNDDENEFDENMDEEKEDIDYNEKLVTYKLNNGGCIAVDVGFNDAHRDGIIVRNTKLMFGSKLQKRGKKSKKK